MCKALCKPFSKANSSSRQPHEVGRPLYPFRDEVSRHRYKLTHPCHSEYWQKRDLKLAIRVWNGQTVYGFTEPTTLSLPFCGPGARSPEPQGSRALLAKRSHAHVLLLALPLPPPVHLAGGGVCGGLLRRPFQGSHLPRRDTRTETQNSSSVGGPRPGPVNHSTQVGKPGVGATLGSPPALARAAPPGKTPGTSSTP